MKAIIQISNIDKGMAQVRVNLTRHPTNQSYGLFIPHSSSSYLYQIKASTKAGHELFIKHFGYHYFEIDFTHPDFSSEEQDFTLEYQIVSTDINPRSLILKMKDFIIRPIEAFNNFVVEVRFPKIFNVIHSLMSEVSPMTSHFEFELKSTNDFLNQVIVIGNHEGDGFYFESTSKEKGTVLLCYDSINYELQKKIKEQFQKIFNHRLFDDIKNRNKKFHLYFSEKTVPMQCGVMYIIAIENYLQTFLLKIFNDPFLVNRILVDIGELDRDKHLSNLLQLLKINAGLKFDDQVSQPRYPENTDSKDQHYFQEFSIDWNTILELESWYQYFSNQNYDGNPITLIQFFEKNIKR